MEYDDVRDAAMGRDAAEELAEGLYAAGGSANADDQVLKGYRDPGGSVDSSSRMSPPCGQ